MRKLFALAMVVVLSTTLAFALVSCGKKAEEASTPPPAESSQPSTMSSDSGMSQGGMAAPAESTMKK
jgi:hypothetical protein